MNKQKVLTAFILLLTFTYAKGQDRIITRENDTIFCHIVFLSLKYITYEVNYNQTTIENSIPMKQVREYSLGRQPIEQPVPTPSNKERKAESGPTPSNKERAADSAPTPSNKERKAEIVPTPSNKERKAETVPTPSNKERTAETVPTPSNKERTAESVPTPSNKERTVESVSTPSNKERTAETVPTSSNRERTVESVPTPSNKERTAESVPTPSNKERTAETVPTSSNRERAVETVLTPLDKNLTEPFPRWRIGFQGGGSYLLNSLGPFRQAMKDVGVFPQEQTKKYYESLRSGISVAADIHYLITRSLGIGLKYSLFTSSTQMDYTVVDNSFDMPAYYWVDEKERFYLNYIGPSFLYRQWLDENHTFSLNGELSLGCIFYRAEAKFDPNRYVFINPETNNRQYNILKEGNTFSGNIQLSLEYYPVSWLSFNINAGVCPVVFRSLKISDDDTSVIKHFDKYDYRDLSRMDYSIGVHFHF